MIRLIEDEQIVPVSFGAGPSATVFQIRKANSGHVEDCVRRATTKGVYDASLYERLVWHFILRGWSNLGAANGGPPVPFDDDPDAKIAVVRKLPSGVKSRLEATALGGNAEESEALGNSEPS